MTDKEAMKLALFALDIVKIHYTQNRHVNEAIAALKERLADPMREVQRLGQEIEPDDIASILACRDMLDAQPVPEFDRVIWPERTWVGLTDVEMYEAVRPLCNHDQIARALVAVSKDEYQAIEAKLKQKNGFAEEKNAICSPFMISELWRLQK